MMITNIPEWWMWIILVALLAAMAYWDVKGRPTRHRLLRFIAIVLAMFSMLMLYMKPYWTMESDAMRVAIITANPEKEVLDSLRNGQVEMLNSFDDYLLKTRETTIDELIVVGDGLEKWELEKLDRSFTFLSNKQFVEGPFDYWPSEGTERSAMQLSIGVQLVDSSKLVLSGPGITPMTKKLEKGQSKVCFEVVPNLSGNLLYQLTGIRAKDTVFREIMPMRVKPAKTTAVLVLTSAPSFELRNLKTHLAAAGFAVAERQKVSKETYHQSFVNLQQKNLSRLSTSLLESFQLVIVDGGAYDALSSSDRRNLLDRLNAGELGLVWLGEKGTSAPLSLEKVKDIKRTFTTEGGKIDLAAYTWQASNTESLQLQGQDIGKLKEQGLGKIVVPSLANTYTLLLRGEKTLYANIWKVLLHPVIGKEWMQNEVQLPAFVRVAEPLAFLSTEENVTVDSIKLATTEQWFMDNNWEAIFWPKERGWNTLELASGAADYFVFDSTDWPAQKSQMKQQQTTSYIIDKATTESHPVTSSLPISRWYFFGLFLLAFGYLWVEQRVG